MGFLLFDVTSTLVFLFGYLTVVTLRQKRAPLVIAERRPGDTRPQPQQHD
jgi:hypothetical protein